MRMRPLVGLSMQPIKFRSVDLPLPLGPEMARNSPGSTRRLTSSRAFTQLWSRAKKRLTFSTLTSESVDCMATFPFRALCSEWKVALPETRSRGLLDERSNRLDESFGTPDELPA